MKNFFNLTEEEKIILTKEEIQYYARLDCASKGIIIPQKPINNLKDIEPPTKKYYQVGYESVVFETDEDAQNYVEAKSKALQTSSINNNYDSSRYVTKNINDSKEIKSVILYSKEQAIDLKEILVYNAETSKEWETYNKSLVEYNKIVNSFLEEINEINYKNSRKTYYDKIYNEYLELANNNETIALSFFRKAYKTLSVNEIDEIIIKEILIRDEKEILN